MAMTLMPRKVLKGHTVPALGDWVCCRHRAEYGPDECIKGICTENLEAWQNVENPKFTIQAQGFNFIVDLQDVIEVAPQEAVYVAVSSNSDCDVVVRKVFRFLADVSEYLDRWTGDKLQRVKVQALEQHDINFEGIVYTVTGVELRDNDGEFDEIAYELTVTRMAII